MGLKIDMMIIKTLKKAIQQNQEGSSPESSGRKLAELKERVAVRDKEINELWEEF